MKNQNQQKSAENQAKTQTQQGFQPKFASFVTFPENPHLESVSTLVFEKWVRLVKSVTRKRLSFRAKRGIPMLLAKGIPRFARNDRLIIKKSAENQAETQSPQGFPAQFASFVTFPENPLSESVSTLVFEKWVRLVKSPKRAMKWPLMVRPAGPLFGNFLLAGSNMAEGCKIDLSPKKRELIVYAYV